MSEDWKSFRLVPDDVLFFRDGKPNTRGSDHYLRSLFPPNPSTLHGALRTRRLLDEGVDLASLDESAWRRLPGALLEELGGWGGFGSLELRGPWLLCADEPMLPAPADLGLSLAERSPNRQLRSKRRRGGLTPPRPPTVERVARFRLSSASDGGHSHGCELLRPYVYDGTRWEPWPSNLPEPRPATGWYLTAAGLHRWRRGQVPDPGDLIHRSELWADEMRTGLGLEAGDRRSEDHMLYTYGFVRLRVGVGIGFEVRGTRLTAGGSLRLGGEGRTCRLEAGPPFPAVTRETAASADRCLRVALATPGLSEAGGYPPGFSPATRLGSMGGRQLRLVGAVMGGFMLAGGWDVARGRAKPLRRALPPGSVFLFEDREAGAAAALDGINVSNFRSESLALQGFGLVMAGAEP